jgi:hypothetical protein
LSSRTVLPAVLAVGVPAVFFLMTLQGGVSYWDTGEMQTVPWLFGIPHPTGFPAYVLLVGTFSHLLPIGTVAWRAAFFCTCFMIGCVGVVYAVIVRACDDRPTAVLACWALAFGVFFWTDGVRAEIHTLEALCGALALRGFIAGTRWFKTGAVFFGLGLATHPLVGLLLPGIALLVLWRYRELDRRLVLAMIGLAALPLLLYAYLPIRSHIVVAQHLDPAQQLGKPLGGAMWNTDDPQTLDGFVKIVSGSQFNAGGSVLNALNPVVIAATFARIGDLLLQEFTPFGIALAAICAGLMVRRSPWLVAALLLCALLPFSFALTYKDLVEPERYLFVSFSCVALIIALGIGSVEPRYRNLLRFPLAAVAMFLLVSNYAHARQLSKTDGLQLVHAVKQLTPRHSIVIAEWAYGTPLAYDDYVLHDFDDRRLDIAWPFQDEKFVSQWVKSTRVYYVGDPYPGYNMVLCPINSPSYAIWRVRIRPAPC